MNLRILIPAIFAAVATFGPLSTLAACLSYPTSAEEFASADYVMMAWVTGARMDRLPNEREEFDGIEYTIEPLKVFKGEPPPAMVVYSENSTARFPMMVSGWYLVFIGPEHDVGLQTPPRRARSIGACGNSFTLLSVPLALQAPPTELTFEELMALAPSRD